METAIDFKSLRAKFQEEMHSKETPVVHEKTKRFLPPAGISGSFLPRVDSTTGAKNPSEPPVPMREDRKQPSTKRPISVPSCFQVMTSGGVATRQSFKDRHLPQVLPLSFSNEAKQDSSPKLVTSPIKYNRKAMPTPFKPTTFSKCIKDILDHAGEPAEKSKLSRLPVERSDREPGIIGNGFNHNSGGSKCEYMCPNQDQPITPPPTEGNSPALGSVTHVLSTLEKAKRRFSPKNLLVYAKPKSFYSTKVDSESPPPFEDLHHEAGLGSLQAGHSHPTSPTFCPSPPLNGAAQLGGVVVNPDGEVNPSAAPPLRPLPHLASLGPLPPKPPRPPQVDLSSYKLCSLVQDCRTEKHFTNVLATGTPAVPPPPQFDAPYFPDFESSVLEALNINGIHLSPLDLEATEFGVPPANDLLLPPRADLQKAERCDEMIQRLIAGSAEAAPGRGSTAPGRGSTAPGRGSTAPRRGSTAPGQGSTAPGRGSTALECWADAQSVTALRPDLSGAGSSDSSELPSEPSLSQRWDVDIIYEEVEAAAKFHFGQNSRKRKETPKNPYADSAVKEETHKNVHCAPQWTSESAESSCLRTAQCDGVRKERVSPDPQEEKEFRKREKQRLERERKEQKEREKKESEMKKKFKITGLEEPVYHARVLVASKLCKRDLQVKSGDTISIIRTTNCPKGKWLARDAQHNYGYISVMNVELNMKEMLELGRRASRHVDNTSLSSKSSHHNPTLACSFSEDSEEWSGDEDTLSSVSESMHQLRPPSMPDVFDCSSSSQLVQTGSSTEDLSQYATHTHAREARCSPEASSLLQEHQRSQCCNGTFGLHALQYRWLCPTGSHAQLLVLLCCGGASICGGKCFQFHRHGAAASSRTLR
ncbi:uncharacterized protein LOC143475618 isoform X2 [Brachyhypopomus gauderio]|uniref:uncharacterized protein LOC143475618 isoform X2 n=1 Tax=Brachyhypopomus gauderio TaxID=698409 RepID=UPI004041DB7D